MYVKLSSDHMKIVARSKEHAPGMVWMGEEEHVIGKKAPNSLLQFKETNINAKAATVGHDGKIYIIDAVDSKLKVYDDITDTTKVTVGVQWFASYGEPIQMRVTHKGIVVFSTYGLPSKVYFLETINSTPIIVHEEHDSGWTKDWGVDSYDNGLDAFIFAASYNSSETQPNAIFSKDGGATFTVVKTCKPLSAGAPNNHFHDVAIDPYSGWLWLVEGDATNADLWYSVDLGVNWIAMKLNDYRDPTVVMQPTVVIPFAENILFGRDDGYLRPGVDVLRKPLTSIEIENIEKLHKPLKVIRNDVYAAHYFARSPISKGEEGYMRFEGGGSEIIYLGTGDGGKSAHVVGFGNGLKGLFGMDDNYVYGFSDNQQKIVYSKRVIWG